MWASHQFEFNSEYIIFQYPDWLEGFRSVRVVCGDTEPEYSGNAGMLRCDEQAASAGKYRSDGGVSIYQFANAVFLSPDSPREIHALHWSNNLNTSPARLPILLQHRLSLFVVPTACRLGPGISTSMNSHPVRTAL